MAFHALKTWPSFFEEMATGVKTFELRKDDRSYAVGDKLLLQEWDPKTERYTDRFLSREVSHILRHDPSAGCAATFGLQRGYVVMSLKNTD